MQKIIFILFLLNACLVIATSPLQAQSAPKEIKLKELDNYIRQCDHPLIVNFWATYCAPCLKEIPYLQSTVEKYRDSGVELLLVSLDLPGKYPKQIAACARKWNITTNLVWLDIWNLGYLNFQIIDKKWSGGIPASLFINNKTHYRMFFDRQLTDRQVEQQAKLLVAPPELPSTPPVPQPSP